MPTAHGDRRVRERAFPERAFPRTRAGLGASSGGGASANVCSTLSSFGIGAPLLAALDEPERSQFEASYTKLVDAAYPRRADGKTLFPFRRMFIIAAAG